MFIAPVSIVLAAYVYCSSQHCAGTVTSFVSVLADLLNEMCSHTVILEVLCRAGTSFSTNTVSVRKFKLASVCITQEVCVRACACVYVCVCGH